MSDMKLNNVISTLTNTRVSIRKGDMLVANLSLLFVIIAALCATGLVVITAICAMAMNYEISVTTAAAAQQAAPTGAAVPQ